MIGSLIHWGAVLLFHTSLIVFISLCISFLIGIGNGVSLAHALHNLLCLALNESFDSFLCLFLCLTRSTLNGVYCLRGAVLCLTSCSFCFILSDRTSNLSACYSASRLFSTSLDSRTNLLSNESSGSTNS